MEIGIPKETRHLENRVALTPGAARALVSAGHQVYFEKGAGEISGFSDQEYLQVGVKLVYSLEEIFYRSKMVLMVSPPTTEEYRLMQEDQIVMSSFHLAVAAPENIRLLLEKRVTAIGFEVIEDDEGQLPILVPMSELAGQMCINIASYYLSNRGGGRGVLLGGAAGIPPATVVVLGAGTLGLSAVRTAKGMGCNVILFDNDIRKLRYANELYNKQLVTYLPFVQNLEKAVKIADVVVGAILIHGEKPPKLITEEMVKEMKPQSLIIDASIDQGGCVETSHPTNWANATFIKHGITHFCVPNMPSNISRTATYAISNAVLPYAYQIAELGIEEAMRRDPGLARGAYTFRGYASRRVVASRLGIESKSIKDILGMGQ